MNTCISYQKNGVRCGNNSKHDVEGHSVCGRHFRTFYLSAEDAIRNKTGREILDERARVHRDDAILERLNVLENNIDQKVQDVSNKVGKVEKVVLDGFEVSNNMLQAIGMFQAMSFHECAIYLNKMYMQNETDERTIRFILAKSHPNVDTKQITFASPI